MPSKLLPVLCLIAFSVNAVPIVDLTIRETAGIARIDEDITMGVPLPENGLYTDASKITLRDASNNIIPCEVKKISNWYKTPQNLRWLQLNFPYSIAANATKTVTLSLDASAYTLSSKLTAVDNGTTITVNTGKVRFIVKKANFNLLDQVWIDESGAENYADANKIVNTHSRGVIHYLSNTEYLSSNDAASTAVIERQGPGVVTIKATGLLKNAGNSATLAFVTRIYAYNNSQTVKISNTIEFRNVDPTLTVNIQGVHLEIPLNFAANTKRAVVGKPGGYSTADISGAQDVYCMTERAAGSLTTAGLGITGSIGGQVAASAFDPIALKPKDVGWVSLDDGSKGCVMAMRYFWQMVPTSVEAFGDGRIIAGAFSKRSGQNPLPLYAGTGRTCETQWTFFNSASPDTLRSKAAAGTDRLFALASPFWYTRRTLSAVHMVEVNQNIYAPADWAVVSAWDTKMAAIWENVFGKDDLYRNLDSYGFLEWGDNPLNPSGLAAPCDVKWNGNYYGLDFFALEHFYHTGDLRHLRFGLAHARHVEDVHQLHFGDADPNTGSSRYCPPSNHIATDDGLCTPDFGNMSHHKSEGMFMDYYLTGNDYALQCALEAANWSERQGFSLANGPSDNIKTYVRRWAHQMNDLCWAYEYNQASKYYARLWQNWEVFRRNIRLLDTPTMGNNGDTMAVIGQPFMVGLAMEAVVKMYYILSPTYTTNTGAVKQDSIAFYLKMWCDTVDTWPQGTGSMGINSNVTVGYAFLSQFYGAAYLTKAASKASTLPAVPDSVHKFFPQQARNMEMAMYYFAIPDSVNGYSGVEFKPVRLPGANDPGLSISATPTPFSYSTLIRVSGRLLAGNAAPDLRVYTLDGVLCKDLSAEAANPGHEVLFSPGKGASNVYLIKCTVGNRVVSKKVILFK